MKRPGYGNLLGSRDTHSTKPQKVDSGTTHLFSRLLFCRCRRRHAAKLGQTAKILQKLHCGLSMMSLGKSPWKDFMESPDERCKNRLGNSPQKLFRHIGVFPRGHWNIIDDPQHILKKLVKLTDYTYA